MISPRKRRRRTPSTNEDDLISDLLKDTLDQSENNTHRKRRTPQTQSQPDQSDPKQLEIEQSEIEQDELKYPELINNQTQILNTAEIDQIRSELIEEQYSILIDEYWDESHDWSIDDPSHSSDYWHFLGQYE